MRSKIDFFRIFNVKKTIYVTKLRRPSIYLRRKHYPSVQPFTALSGHSPRQPGANIRRLMRPRMAANRTRIQCHHPIGLGRDESNGEILVGMKMCLQVASRLTVYPSRSIRRPARWTVLSRSLSSRYLGLEEG